jgi:transcriptional regulator with XRE-family HTH domain
MVTRIGPKRLRRRLYIDEWMAERDLSDEKLGGRLGVARQTVFRWRREQWRLDTEKIGLLAEALGIEPEELWRPPSRPSIDALLKDATPEMRDTAADIVRRLIGKKAS